MVVLIGLVMGSASVAADAPSRPHDLLDMRPFRATTSQLLPGSSTTPDPIVASISVEGLRRTPRRVLLTLTGVRPGQRLSSGGLLHAARRIEEFPTSTQSSLRSTPTTTGVTALTAEVHERHLLPSDWIDLTSVIAHALITRTIRINISAPFSHGDLWQPALRWPRARRLVGLDVSVPVPGGVKGLLRVETFRERQTYARPSESSGQFEEVRRRFGASYGDWVNGYLRLEGGAFADHLNGEQYLALKGVATTRLWRDHVVTHLRGDRWFSPGADHPGHYTLDAVVDWRSTTADDRPQWKLRTGAAMASADAPLALWPGAGSSLDRTALLRARPLIRRHIVSGEMFGRRLAFASIERQHPVWRSARGAAALAAFVDAGQAWDRLDDAPDSPLEVDAGGGVRVGRPGDVSQVRVDVAVGLRDGRVRASIGYVTAWGKR
jgi:hypothetical protein